MGRLEINMRKLKELNGFSLGKKLTIAIDIDGTIADSSGVDFRRVSRKPDEILKAKPIKGALKAVKRLYKEGHTIVFYTCRKNLGTGSTPILDLSLNISQTCPLKHQIIK